MEESTQNIEKQRQTAYKVWIKDILASEYTIQGGWLPNYIVVNGKNISRVNIIATVVSTYTSNEKNYCSIIIDDGSGNINLKTWGEDIKLVENLKVSDVILVVGKPRQSNDANNQLYILPEIVKVLNDPKWMLVRKLELKKLWPEPENTREVPQTAHQKPQTTDYQPPTQNKKSDYEEPVEEVVE